MLLSGKCVQVGDQSRDMKDSPNFVLRTHEIFAVLSDPLVARMLKIAYSGVKCDFSNIAGKLIKRQYLTQLKRLRELGLVERQQDKMYRTTSFATLQLFGQRRPQRVIHVIMSKI